MFELIQLGRQTWLWICLVVLAPGLASAESREYQIKAAFLLNFTQFVTWPPDAFANDAAPFCIGVLGDDPFGAALDQTVRGEEISGHKIVVRRSQQITDCKGCQMVFVSKSAKNRATEALSELNTKPILTVSEIDGFARRGGVINFYLDGTKVRFEINPAAARNDGLKVSSQLLSLGKIIQSAKEDK